MKLFAFLLLSITATQSSAQNPVAISYACVSFTGGIIFRGTTTSLEHMDRLEQSCFLYRGRYLRTSYLF